MRGSGGVDIAWPDAIAWSTRLHRRTTQSCCAYKAIIKRQNHDESAVRMTRQFVVCEAPQYGKNDFSASIEPKKHGLISFKNLQCCMPLPSSRFHYESHLTSYNNGKIQLLSIGYVLKSISFISYQNWFACFKVIARRINDNFWDTVHTA